MKDISLPRGSLTRCRFRSLRLPGYHPTHGRDHADQTQHSQDAECAEDRDYNIMPVITFLN